MKRTPTIAKLLFPNLKGKWGEININEIAVRLSALIGPMLAVDENPFLDPQTCENWKNFVHSVMGVDYSWGGYMEDRSVVWRGHYHEPGHTFHLGVDFYVPEGSFVFAPTPCKLVHTLDDEDQEGGWGGRLIFEWNHGFFILGHLDAEDMVTEDRNYIPGEVVGIIASPEKNGGWSPHLHLQCMNKLDPNVDGYAKYYEGIEKDFLNPLKLSW